MAFVANRNVEIPIRAKLHVAAVVVVALVPLRDQRELRRRIGRHGSIKTARCPGCREPGDSLMNGATNLKAVEDKEVPVLIVVGMKGQAEYPVVAIDSQGAPLRRKISIQRDKRRRRHCVQIDALDARPPFDDEQVSLHSGRRCHINGIGEPKVAQGILRRESRGDREFVR